MAVVFKRKFTQSDIRRFVTRKVEQLDQVIIDQFRQVGEQFVIDARNLSTYKDITGNLRSSIGYAISKNGKVIEISFEGDTGAGRKEGRRTAREFATKLPKGYSLVVVAGMFYAGYVEHNGYDVITGPGIRAGKNLKRQFEKIKKILNRRKK